MLHFQSPSVAYSNDWLDFIRDGDPLVQAQKAVDLGMSPYQRVEDGALLVHRLLFEQNPGYYTSAIKFLLQQAGDVEMPDDYGWSVLSSASFSGDKLLDLTSWLLEQGADPLRAGGNTRSPIFRTLDGRKPYYRIGDEPQNVQVLHRLISCAGPEIMTQCDRHGRTALQVATSRRDYPAIAVMEDWIWTWRSQDIRGRIMDIVYRVRQGDWGEEPGRRAL